MNALLRFFGVALLAGALAVPAPTDACAPAPPRDVVVEVASESAIIVWDAEAKTQHFIRWATFSASAPGSAVVQDFGFLVPTPSVPALEEVDDKAFDELAKITAPKTVTRPRPSGGGCEFGCGGSKTAVDGPTVEVLAAKHVGGYDAKVLKANDADALTAWLTAGGYAVRPALTAWLAPYIAKGWVVTAFKIGRDPAAPPAGAVGSAAVRMSFTTATPFFPYREPDDMHDAKTPRLLRVFALAGQKLDGKLGSTADWPGRVVWADKPGAEAWKGVLPLLKIPGYEPTEATWLTEFEDHASPRPGTSDLTFVPNADQTPVHRPDRVVYAACGDLGAAPAFAGIAAVAACLFFSRFLGVLVRKW